jgi:hypothetical protein
MEYIAKLLHQGGFFVYLTLALGLLANIGSIAALAVVLRSKSRDLSLWLSVAGLVAVLIIMGAALIGFQRSWTMVQQAICALPEHITALKLRGYADSAGSISLGLHLSMFPFTLSIGLLVYGLMRSPAAEERTGTTTRWLVFLVCSLLGMGLGLAALCIYLRFDDVLLLLSWMWK